MRRGGRSYGILVWCLRNTLHSAARSFGQERGVPTAHIRNGSVREAQRSAWPKERPPRGLRRKWPADFVTRRLQPHEGDAPSACLVIGPFWAQQNASYFANTTLASSFPNPPRRVPAWSGIPPLQAYSIANCQPMRMNMNDTGGILLAESLCRMNSASRSFPDPERKPLDRLPCGLIPQRRLSQDLRHSIEVPYPAGPSYLACLD